MGPKFITGAEWRSLGTTLRMSELSTHSCPRYQLGGGRGHVAAGAAGFAGAFS